MDRKLNIKKMIVKGILGIFVGPVFGLFIAGIVGNVVQLSNTAFWPLFLVIWILTIILFGFWGAKSKTKEETQAELQQAMVSEEGLTRNEKIAAWIFSVLNPVITGSVMYYMWRKRYPAKARSANKISIIVFLIEFVLGVLIIIATISAQ